MEEIDQTVRHSLKFVTADHVDAILDVALNRLEAEQSQPQQTAVKSGSVPPQSKPADGTARIGQ